MDFEGIYQSYCKDVFRYLRSLSAGEDLAEEITQETFVKALKAIDRFQGDKDIRAWLFTIAKHTYYTHCKREKRTTGEEFPPSIPGPENYYFPITRSFILESSSRLWRVSTYIKHRLV